MILQIIKKKNQAVDLGIGGGSSAPVFLLSCHTEHSTGGTSITKCVGVFSKPSSSPRHGLVGLQLNSDTICLEKASIPQVKGSVPLNCPPLQMPRLPTISV